MPSKAVKHLMKALPILFATVPIVASAECQKFSPSAGFNLTEAITEISQSNLVGDQRDENSFTEIWTKYTLSPVPEPSKILVDIALGYRAIDGEYHAAALSSFESAFISINDSNLCEAKLVHFLVFSGRTASTFALLRSHPVEAERHVLSDGTYLTMTSNLNRPEMRLVSSDLHTLACLLLEFAERENMSELQEAISVCRER